MSFYKHYYLANIEKRFYVFFLIYFLDSMKKRRYRISYIVSERKKFEEEGTLSREHNMVKENLHRI